MQKAFEESRNRMRLKKYKELKKQQKRNNIIELGLATILIALILISCNMGKNAKSNCIKNGHSVSYCEAHM